MSLWWRGKAMSKRVVSRVRSILYPHGKKQVSAAVRWAAAFFLGGGRLVCQSLYSLAVRFRSLCPITSHLSNLCPLWWWQVMEALGVGIGLKTVCIVGGIDMFQQVITRSSVSCTQRGRQRRWSQSTTRVSGVVDDGRAGSSVQAVI